MTSKITISRGATVNIGNYESARVEVSFEGTDIDVIDQVVCNELFTRVMAIQRNAGLPPMDAKRFTGK